MFGAIGAVSPQELGGNIGAPERVGQSTGAPLATPRWRRHGILPTALKADFDGLGSPAPTTHDSAKVALNYAGHAAVAATE